VPSDSSSWAAVALAPASAGSSGHPLKPGVPTLVRYQRKAPPARRGRSVCQTETGPSGGVSPCRSRCSDKSSDPRILYKTKLRVVLWNGADVPVTVGPGRWSTTPTGIHPTQDVAYFQTEGPDGWQRNDWKAEGPTVTVPSYHHARFWIGLPEALSDVDVRRKHEARELGLLRVTLAAGAHKFTDRTIAL
jgi:hypothetical protein